MNVQRFLTFVLLVSLAIASHASTSYSSAAPLTTPALSPASEYTLYHTFFCRNYFDHTSTLYLQNLTNSTAAVVLDFYDVTWGSGTASVAETIPARGTLVVPADSVDGLQDGRCYSLVSSSDQPAQSVVHMYRSSGDGDRLGVYRGVSSGNTLQHFGPFYKNKNGTEIYSGLTVWNVGTEATTIIADFLNTDGSKATTVEAVVAPGEQYAYLGLIMYELPDGFSGWVRITATQPVVGLLLESILVYQGSLGTGATQSYVPRVLKGIDEGSGPRTTTIFVGNTDSAEADATLDYYRADGTLEHSSTFTLPASGAITFDLGDEGNLPSGNTWAVVLSGDQSLVIGEQTDYDTTSYSAGVYGTDADTVLGLSRLAYTDAAHTVFSVQNLGASATTMSVDYYDLTGALVFNQSAPLSPGGWVRYDQRQMTQLGDDFEGSAVVSSDQPLMAWVDECSDRFTIHLPIITKLWPPVPDIPMLYHIINPDEDGNYIVCWSTAARATSYTLEEDDNSAFSSPTTRYSGSETCWTASDKETGTYYYRVRASNSWGNSGWSNVESVIAHRWPTKFYSVADTTVLQGYPGENFGYTSDMWAGYDDYLDPDGKIVRSLVQFDLAGIPSGTQIDSAYLELYLVTAWDYPDRSRTITTYRIKSGWSEMSVTWNTKPSYGESYGTASVTHGEWKWYSFDVTDLVRAWVNGTKSNHGIMVRGPEHSGQDSSWRGFSTREGPYPPRLVINYTASTVSAAPADPVVGVVPSESILNVMRAVGHGGHVPGLDAVRRLDMLAR